MHNRRLMAVIGLAATFLGAAGVNAAPTARTAPQCFNSHDWSGWKVTDDAKSMYIRVNLRDFYRLDFVDTCRAAQSIGAHLITQVRGSSSICDPLDLDLKVADDSGFTTPCLVSKITPLSADEAAALPKALVP